MGSMLNMKSALPIAIGSKSSAVIADEVILSLLILLMLLLPHLPVLSADTSDEAAK